MLKKKPNSRIWLFFIGSLGMRRWINLKIILVLQLFLW